MKFGALQGDFFGTSNGAYSIVTEDEWKKGQITLTEVDGESRIAIDHFGLDQIPRRVAGSRKMEVKTISADKKESAAKLTINFPKSSGDELRIYRMESQCLVFAKQIA